MGLNKEEAKTLCFSNKKMLCCDRFVLFLPVIFQKYNFTILYTEYNCIYLTFSCYVFLLLLSLLIRHISNMYHIPLVLSGEIACVGHSNDKTIHQDVAFLHECSSIVSFLSFFIKYRSFHLVFILSKIYKSQLIIQNQNILVFIL